MCASTMTGMVYCARGGEALSPAPSPTRGGAAPRRFLADGNGHHRISRRASACGLHIILKCATAGRDARDRAAEYAAIRGGRYRTAGAGVARAAGVVRDRGTGGAALAPYARPLRH